MNESALCFGTAVPPPLLKHQALALSQAHWHHARLAIHAALPADLTRAQAYERAEAAETLIRAKMLQIRRITIHKEPEE